MEPEFIFDLPTEAQWEYACRAGTTGDYAGKLDEMTWYDGNSGIRTHPVGQKKPNAFGLYDMHGNVWEWCRDWYDENFYSKSSVADPENRIQNRDKVLRGGAWDSSSGSCRSSNRSKTDPANFLNIFGFRVVAVKR